MPRQARVTTEDILEVLQQLPIFEETSRCSSKRDRVIKKFGDPVWIEACERLNHRITKANLYVTVSENRRKDADRRNGILDKLKFIKFGLNTNHIENFHNNNSERSRGNVSGDEVEMEDQLCAILEITCGSRCCNFVRKFELKPFYFIYYLPEQISLYKDMLKLENATLVMFTSEGLVSKARLGHCVTKSIQIFVIGFHCKDVIIPVAQALIEDKDEQFVTTFCSAFMQDALTVPSVIVVGYDSLLSALMFSINYLSIHEYILEYFLFVNVETEVETIKEFPWTLVRVDITKLLCHMKNYFRADTPVAVEKFYFKMIIILSQEREFESFKTTARRVMLLASSPHVNKMTEISRKKLKDMIDSSDALRFALIDNLPEFEESEAIPILSDAPDEVIKFFEALNISAPQDLDNIVFTRLPSQEKIQSYLDTNHLEVESCRFCDRPAQIQHALGSYIALDVEHLNLHVPPTAWPKQLEILNSSFSLVGLIAKQISDKEKTYVAYTTTAFGRGQWKRYDSTKLASESLKTLFNVTVCLAVYIKIAS
ncbi:hypothetical protein QAD02_018880 [Eretmocerus hayati]|uniref:Uncharacterized protein n=1 Tax=Eretmocerus hayati TaxID=131215 RepID=A0ACC2PJ32_9HYME|nr:hypothetical protein QAD02_018880 [Eretmocerus hayati]